MRIFSFRQKETGANRVSMARRGEDTMGVICLFQFLMYTYLVPSNLKNTASIFPENFRDIQRLLRIVLQLLLQLV